MKTNKQNIVGEALCWASGWRAGEDSNVFCEDSNVFCAVWGRSCQISVPIPVVCISIIILSSSSTLPLPECDNETLQFEVSPDFSDSNGVSSFLHHWITREWEIFWPNSCSPSLGWQLSKSCHQQSLILIKYFLALWRIIRWAEEPQSSKWIQLIIIWTLELF